MLLDPKRWCRSKRNPENFEAHLADCKAGAGRHKGTAYVGDASKQASSQANKQASTMCAGRIRLSLDPTCLLKKATRE